MVLQELETAAADESRPRDDDREPSGQSRTDPGSEIDYDSRRFMDRVELYRARFSLAIYTYIRLRIDARACNFARDFSISSNASMLVQRSLSHSLLFSLSPFIPLLSFSPFLSGPPAVILQCLDAALGGCMQILGRRATCTIRKIRRPHDIFIKVTVCPVRFLILSLFPLSLFISVIRYDRGTRLLLPDRSLKQKNTCDYRAHRAARHRRHLPITGAFLFY